MRSQSQRPPKILQLNFIAEPPHTIKNIRKVITLPQLTNNVISSYSYTLKLMASGVNCRAEHITYVLLLTW